jgi:hypothetical protein
MALYYYSHAARPGDGLPMVALFFEDSPPHEYYSYAYEWLLSVYVPMCTSEILWNSGNRNRNSEFKEDHQQIFGEFFQPEFTGFGPELEFCFDGGVRQIGKIGIPNLEMESWNATQTRCRS